MTRRKGEVTDKQRNLSHPYQVELATPLGRGYDIISRWAAWHDHVTTGGSRSMCWCFRRPEVADAFAMDFGGRRIDRPVQPYYVEADLPDAKELERRAKGARVGLDIVMGGREFDYSRPFRGVEKIPFSSFSSPADVARAQGALDKAWDVVKGDVPEADHERERVRLAYIVASFALVALDDEDLAGRAIVRFRQGPRKG